MKKILSLVLLFLLTVPAVHAGEDIFNNPRGRVNPFLLGLSCGAKAGTTVYFGDLVDAGRARWTIGAFGEKNVNSWLAVRLALDAGQCHGGQDEGIEFKTTFVDVDALAVVYFFDLIQGYDDARPFNPYFGIGAGGVFFSADKHPSSDYDVEKAMANASDPEKLESWLYYKPGLEVTGAAVGMLGVRYSLTSKLSLTFDLQGDLLFTDLFDGHDGYWQGETWEDGKPFDCLWTASLGFKYRFVDFNYWSNKSSKYSRKSYLRNKRIYKRNATRQRRR